MNGDGQPRSARSGGRPRMFVRLLLRAMLVRRGRALTALAAVLVASGATAAMLNLYVDVQAKLQREFRGYGANLIVVAPQGATLPEDALAQVDAALAGRGTAAPFAYVIAKTSDGAPVVVAGTDFTRARKLDSFWAVTKWPDTPAGALVGRRAASLLSPEGKPFDLTFGGKPLRLAQAGILKTGAAEDSRVYLSLPEFTAWTGVGATSIEVAASGTPEEIRQVMQRLASTLPGAEVRPLRQIQEGEARVLGKTRATLLASIALIILTAALCLLATLTAWVMEHRKDFAVMKALGASHRMVNAFFAAQAAALGALGATLGFFLGVGVAAWIGRANFQAAVTPRLSLFPAVVLGSIAVALLAAVLPMSILRRVQPAAILRGE